MYALLYMLKYFPFRKNDNVNFKDKYVTKHGQKLLCAFFILLPFYQLKNEGVSIVIFPCELRVGNHLCKQKWKNII